MLYGHCRYDKYMQIILCPATGHYVHYGFSLFRGVGCFVSLYTKNTYGEFTQNVLFLSLEMDYVVNRVDNGRLYTITIYQERD